MWQYFSAKTPIEQVLISIPQMRDRFQKLIDEYGVRKQVEEVRNKIKTAYPDLQFKEDTHQYFYKNVELIPMSYFIDFFTEETDFQKVAKNYAIKNGQTAEFWLQAWKNKKDIACVSGTLTHLYGETLTNLIWKDDVDETFLKHFQNEDYLLPLYPKQVAIARFFEDLYKNKVIPVIAECKLIYEDISGTFDLLCLNLNTKEFEIYDYKTNSELTKAFKKPMLKPFENLNEEPLSHYLIQQNGYAIFLNKIDIKANKANLVWVKDNEQYEIVPIRNIQKEVLAAIDYIRSLPD